MLPATTNLQVRTDKYLSNTLRQRSFVEQITLKKKTNKTINWILTIPFTDWLDKIGDDRYWSSTWTCAAHVNQMILHVTTLYNQKVTGQFQAVSASSLFLLLACDANTRTRSKTIKRREARLPPSLLVSFAKLHSFKLSNRAEDFSNKSQLVVANTATRSYNNSP